MAEAIISRRGKTEPKQNYTLIVNTIIENGFFSVPEARDQLFSVRLFGGGGGGGYAGGGGGWMNNADLELEQGQAIAITIGAGGISNAYALNSGGTSGGTTSFGGYLSANGGTAATKSSYTYNGNGGSGGSGGGGYGSYYISQSSGNFGKGGTGYQFGGGSPGGNGGPWGGGGAGTTGVVRPGTNYSWYRYFQVTVPGGIGGTYGGNGSIIGNGGNGTNTINDNSVDNSYQGYGISGYGMTTNLSMVTMFNNSNAFYQGTTIRSGGSGGGYGGNGGASSNVLPSVLGGVSGGGSTWTTGYGFCTGGGGGYGADGGSAVVTYWNTREVIGYHTGCTIAGSGGGGYGKAGQGGNASIVSGYTTLAMGLAYGYGGGGGSYGCGAESDGVGHNKGAGYGGGGSGNLPGGQGICIIQWYGIPESN